MSKKTGITFKVGEQDSGTPYIQMWFDDVVPGLPDNPPVFEVKAGSSMQEVEAIAAYLNQTLTSFRL
ncbi:hypothetical protein [Pseudomonas amygdali]|uniref:hypothetical protein n=1 Tax=Pseudomonas amygdali TaxID=47877 RepID=UPI000E3D91DA|nr:hypothetical protein [Pseudomonas amygdali]